MGICPHHCPSPRGSGGAVLAVLGVAAAAAVARPVIHAAEIMAEILVIVLASCAAAAVLAGIAWAAVRVHHWRARRSAAALPAARVQALQRAPRRAIEAPRQTVTGPAPVSRVNARRVP